MKATTEMLFIGLLDELRFMKGIVNEEDLLGGVAADYSYHRSTPTCSATTTVTNGMGTIHDGSVVGKEYTNSMTCKWLIDQTTLNPSAATDTFITLTFTRFGTEIDSDVVSVYDGGLETDPILGVFSGYNVPAIPLLSSGKKMLVVFRTDSRQRGVQDGWAAKYSSISMAQSACGTVAQGQTLKLACPSGHSISKINFGSYGAGQTGYCSNAGGAGVGKQSDVKGAVFNDNSNVDGVMNYTQAGIGTGGTPAGPLLLKTGFCHAIASRKILEAACIAKNSCSIVATDAVFNAGVDPCLGFNDSKNGTEGMHNDPAVKGADSYPRTQRPYASLISKRLFAQVTCEADKSFATNCFQECSANGKCLYGLKNPNCGWCKQYGLIRNSKGMYEGQGCGKAYCVKWATCGALQSS